MSIIDVLMHFQNHISFFPLQLIATQLRQCEPQPHLFHLLHNVRNDFRLILKSDLHVINSCDNRHHHRRCRRRRRRVVINTDCGLEKIIKTNSRNIF